MIQIDCKHSCEYDILRFLKLPFVKTSFRMSFISTLSA
jgi:hypothetical protein